MSGAAFDLTVRRPQVLLFGNGLVYRKNWSEVISDVSGEREDQFSKGSVPYSLQSSAQLPVIDKERNGRYFNYFGGKTQAEPCYRYDGDFPILKTLADFDFDAYLTTNYTYEMENVLCPDFYKRNDIVKQYVRSTQQKKDTKRNKYTYNAIEYGGRRRKSGTSTEKLVKSLRSFLHMMSIAD